MTGFFYNTCLCGNTLELLHCHAGCCKQSSIISSLLRLAFFQLFSAKNPPPTRPGCMFSNIKDFRQKINMMVSWINRKILRLIKFKLKIWNLCWFKNQSFFGSSLGIRPSIYVMKRWYNEPKTHTGLWSPVRWYLSPKYGKFENWLKVMMFDINITRDRWGTVLNIFRQYLRYLLLKFWDIYQKCSNSVNFWARKSFFFNGFEFSQKLIGTRI